ncbi:uncharacterized protein NPIL_397691 [Nephila pilipes]|uniref:RING-type E3 ubiquitin transferase n=1 Tax=Nephila pilipes TaxID=299642 RepID=A0A8X6MRC2_NEPPI|nr:uncharacterized protein NPIL_397691 [Nephila pilipes]
MCLVTPEKVPQPVVIDFYSGKKSRQEKQEPHQVDSNQRTQMEDENCNEICTICFSNISNRAFINTCFHSFCFQCISNWTKQRNVCPLCINKTETLIYNIISDSEYEEVRVATPPPFTESVSFVIREAMEDFVEIARMHQNICAPQSLRLNNRIRTTSSLQYMFRRTVYQESAWCIPRIPPDEFRVIASTLSLPYDEDVRRITPWLMRELHILVNEELIQPVFELLIRLAEDHLILSNFITNTLIRFLGCHTWHFQYELFCFCYSNLIMRQFDTTVIYHSDEVDERVEPSNALPWNPISSEEINHLGYETIMIDLEIEDHDREIKRTPNDSMDAEAVSNITVGGKRLRKRKQICYTEEEEEDLHPQSSTSNKYSKPAIINGHRVTALLDTGSSICFLKESVARNLELNILPHKKDIYLFGNQLNPITQSLGMITVDLQIEEALANNVYVFIVPDTTPPVDFLVGRPFLDLPHIVQARIGEELRIG